ncbi:class I SAM-dependent RNA methyltransferase [Sphingomonas sp. MAH-20]|uniref:Class I SAM-dependent RNA methyltransferase n=1 Tax=Sphingomonas horti TaxID=2682842 RepID=A0A6I4IYF9_9SPHN|nr:class I SAM-dependent RNA methyltransferase [Sphingomonas sp. CGMCC 1.13658]MBA2920247.1 class I SAM-dependent RNA methyltransferase [Sphingomonas sp. CGMCC 1.13658]MVO76501.1 class I SAM-dependent RNA methyltransferase [Sphingomonas horti]
MTDLNLIVRVAARGDGVTADGRFAPLAAPGDRLLADGSVEPGPHHQPPPCRHFPECGGCQLQHLDDQSYAGFVRDRIANALEGQGLKLPDFAPVHLSQARTRRRASLSAQRIGRRVLLGFKQERSNRIEDMRECHILHPELFALVEPLRALLAALLPDKRAATVKMTLADQGADLLLEGASADTLAAAEALTGFADRHGLARLSLDDGFGPQTRWEPQPVTVTLSGTPVLLPHDAFLQATADGEAALVAAVREALGDAAVTADLFAGIGTFALSLAGKLYAAEASRDAVLTLKSSGRGLFVEHRDLYRRPLSTAELNRFEAVVLDPPRAGAEAQAQQLAASTVPRIAYVSCNPASFARDAKLLVAGGYRLAHVTPVGQFRWSTHVELCAAFARG